MNGYDRYAIYYAPEIKSDLGEFGNSWLGRDPFTGLMQSRPEVPGLTISQIQDLTRSPTHYGFHGTLKPPFILKPEARFEELDNALQSFAGQQISIEVGSLSLKHVGNFLALCPSGDLTDLNALASACVKELDFFRPLASEEELAHRRSKGLSHRQDEYLLKWGYPYVMDEFRFHLTLTDALEQSEVESMFDLLRRETAEFCQKPFKVNQICLFGDPGNGSPFRLLKRYNLLSGSL